MHNNYPKFSVVCYCKMAVQAPVPRFFPGDIVSVQGEGRYVVLNISNDIGFNLYHLLETNTGEKKTCSVLNLERILEVEGETQTDIKEEIKIDQKEEKNEENPRFKVLTEVELDDLQRKKTEPSTDKQMKWAVRIFKGK